MSVIRPHVRLESLTYYSDYSYLSATFSRKGRFDDRFHGEHA
jgi:hypothetical protein